MRLSILTIGKMKKGPEADLLARYLERAKKAGGQLGLSGPEVREWGESRQASDQQRKDDEAQMMLEALKPGGFLIALDEHGKDLTSVELSQRLRDCLDRSVPEIAFAIGGPDGHGQAVLQRADLVLRMGRLTWPHQLARVMLAEQVYRAITILNGHPYHRE